MKTKGLIVISLFMIMQDAMSQKIENMASFRNMRSTSYFRFNYDNDYFAESDKNYTQGYSFEWASPKLKRNPISKLLYKSQNEGSVNGIAIEHIGFTPKNIVSREIQFGDRPFAAAIMLKSFSIAKNSSSNTRIGSSLSLGILGPVAFGQEMQTGIHRAINGKIPGGWHNQIENHLVINYQINHEKQLLRLGNLLSASSYVDAKIGTLFTKATAGFTAVTGLINSPFGNPENEKETEFYLYAQPLINAVAFDATLQGGLIGYKSSYTLKNSNLERFPRQFNFGAVLKFRKMSFEYSRSILSREFKTGYRANWGGIKIGVLID